MTDLSIEQTAIPGLLVVRLPVHVDSRGWFKENWQREKMVALGLPDFEPVQQNVSFNERVGVTRGVHAEPWDKFVSLLTGKAFGAWVDLREGPTFGLSVSLDLTPETAVFVPRGVGNSYQTLEPDTTYSYLVNDHWSPSARERYTFLNLRDPAAAIEWPLPLDDELLSAADLEHPELAQVTPFHSRRPLVLGAGGQVGRALRAEFPEATFLTRAELDLANPTASDSVDWADHDVVINAAAYTAVDLAETPEGRREAWAVNVDGVRRLVETARRRRTPLVHFSSDYVFDGTVEVHDEDEPVSPLGVYGQTKAAGDAIVATHPQHYILRTSWVIGDGHNFVRTMERLARGGVSPSVVDDQLGRPTFAADIARAVRHLLTSGAAYGTYNVSSGGEATTWCGFARAVFAACDREPADVTPVSTAEYGAGKDLAPRPQHSTLSLERLEATGFVPTSWDRALSDHLAAGTGPAQ